MSRERKMSENKTVTLEELREMKRNGELFETRTDASTKSFPEGFWDNATVVLRNNQASNNFEIDADIPAFFKASGAD
ncbi:hypothetical protein KUV57_23685 [Epibacterium sp. DP7N7-1]|nr:hypothetical protein [Epibacterium sp. DP7N7-1]